MKSPSVAVLLVFASGLCACELKVRDTNLPDRAERDEILRRAEEAARAANPFTELSKTVEQVMDRATEAMTDVTNAGAAAARAGAEAATAKVGAEGAYRFRFAKDTVEWVCVGEDGKIDQRIHGGQARGAVEMVEEWEYEIRKNGPAYFMSRLNMDGLKPEEDSQKGMVMSIFTEKAIRVRKKFSTGKGASFSDQDGLEIDAMGGAAGKYKGKYVAVGQEEKEGKKSVCTLSGTFTLEHAGDPSD